MRATCVLDEHRRQDNIRPADLREIADKLGLRLNQHMSRGDKLRFGKHGSIAVDCSRGSWFSFEHNTGGGAVELVELVLRCDWKAARVWLASCGFEQFAWHPGQHAPEPPAPRPKPEPEPAINRDGRAREIWQASRPVAGTLAETYLAGRGLQLGRDMADVLRFHPACPWQRERHPALITLGRNILTGRPQCIQRTALNPDGSKIGRMALGSTAGAVAMLSPDPEVETALALAEGTEDGLALLQAGLWLPVWTTFGTSGLRGFPVLAGIEALTIYRDNDDAGEQAAMQCAERWAESGALVSIETPPGSDFAEALKEVAA